MDIEKDTPPNMHYLQSILEKWNQCRDMDGFSAAILMDLSKAFDTINHDC